MRSLTLLLVTAVLAGPAAVTVRSTGRSLTGPLLSTRIGCRVPALTFGGHELDRQALSRAPALSGC
jgi:hypothetical protein